MARLKYIRCIIRKRCCFLFLFPNPSFTDTDLIPFSEKSIECFLKKEPHVGGIEFFVIKIIVRMYNNRVSLLAIG